MKSYKHELKRRIGGWLIDPEEKYTHSKESRALMNSIQMLMKQLTYKERQSIHVPKPNLETYTRVNDQPNPYPVMKPEITLEIEELPKKQTYATLHHAPSPEVVKHKLHKPVNEDLQSIMEEIKKIRDLGEQR